MPVERVQCSLPKHALENPREFAHDLINPASIVSLCIEYLLGEPHSNQDALTACLKAIRSFVDLAGQITDGIVSLNFLSLSSVHTCLDTLKNLTDIQDQDTLFTATDSCQDILDTFEESSNEIFDLRETCLNIQRKWQLCLKKEGRSPLISDAFEDIPTHFKGNKTNLKRVFNNLISNAIKHTHPTTKIIFSV